jgi:hypothetical protein
MKLEQEGVLFSSRIKNSGKVAKIERIAARLITKSEISSGVDYVGALGLIWLLLNEGDGTSKLVASGICGIIAGITSAEIKKRKE